MHDTKQKNSGYILLYVVIAGSLFVALASSVLISTLRELEISEQEMNAVQARFAAEAGSECISYWQNKVPWPNAPLDTTGTGPPSTIHCDTLKTPVSYTSQAPDADPECDTYSGTIEIGPFLTDNDQCAVVNFEIAPSDETPHVCITKLLVEGYNDCSTDPATQRSIWQLI